MTKPAREHDWKRYLDFIGRQWSGRTTRLGLFEPNQAATQDYWIECGLPLEGIELDQTRDGTVMRLQLGSLGHEIKDPVRISFQLTNTGDEDGIDILDSKARTTVLRLEKD